MDVTRPARPERRPQTGPGEAAPARPRQPVHRSGGFPADGSRFAFRRKERIMRQPPSCRWVRQPGPQLHL